jgi:hypothetical protein
LEKNIETLTLCPAHCYSQPCRPTGQIPLAPERQGNHAVRVLHCRLIAHRRRAHRIIVAPGLAPPTISPPYHLRRPPPRLIYRCRSIQSLLLLFTLPTARSTLQWPPKLPLHGAVNRVPRCLAVCFVGPRRITERRPASSHQRALKPALPTTSSTATMSSTPLSSRRSGPP